MTTFTTNNADIIHAYVSQLRAKGLSNNEIKTLLMEGSFESKVNTSQIQRNKVIAQNDAASKNMTAGALFLLAGILISLFTYLAPFNNITYVFAYLSLFIGCIQYIKGYMQSV